jgi:hypothetical protein
VGDWYYIGHYGQLGPLTREQIDELVLGGVIVRDTYVWRNGMGDWMFAQGCPELASSFQAAEPYSPPPPSPSPNPAPPSYAVSAPQAAYSAPHAPQAPQAPYVSYPDYTLNQPNAYYPTFGGIRSDRSRTAAGILQLFLPGVGRMYLGDLAYGVIQLALCFVTCGVLWIWSFIDGIIILTGGVKLDGYGRYLAD